MRFGVIASVLLHLAIVGAGFLAPNFVKLPDVAPEPYIPLDLIAEAELALKTSVPAVPPEPVVEEEPEPDIPEPVVEEQPAPAEEKPAEKLPEPEPEPAPVVKEPEPKKPEPKPEPPKAKPKPPVKQPEPDLLDTLEKALVDLDPKKNNAQQPRETPSQTTEQADRARAAIGAGDRLTASDEAKMRAAIYRCWAVGTIVGAPEPEKLVVNLEFELNRDGSLASPPRVTNELQINLSGNRFWKVAQREAITAVTKCAPYSFLSPDRYDSWKDFSMTFIPPV
ncbi:hypothetical protein [Hyphococcus sp.]|uniref:hypothetical protein n=1 Tax=Hyphococcus sp. TaxID=2038636 RepID=UPI00207F7AF0|nr:MAG: hypothetical protein DHS20C04_22390 [Marinicaulis sp.]